MAVLGGCPDLEEKEAEEAPAEGRRRRRTCRCRERRRWGRGRRRRQGGGGVVGGGAEGDMRGSWVGQHRRRPPCHIGSDAASGLLVLRWIFPIFRWLDEVGEEIGRQGHICKCVTEWWWLPFHKMPYSRIYRYPKEKSKEHINHKNTRRNAQSHDDMSS